MPSMIIKPAMADYKNKAEVMAAWKSGRDFIIQNFYHAYHGKPMSVRNVDTLIAEGFTHVEIRYARLTKCVFLDIR